MTQPTGPTPPPFDVGHPFLQPAPAQPWVTVVDTPAGQRLALTIRTPSTTLTVFLSRDEAEEWARLITSAASKVSALLVAGAVPPAMPMPSASSHGRPS
jgi:hypothetical protein